MKKLLVGFFSLLCASAVAQNALVIPDTLTGPVYNLTMHTDSMQFFPGMVSHTYGFNANHYLGPTLILNRGENISINVTNQINDTTTVHWHGLHVPAIWDGGPYSNIIPGDTWHPQFKVMNNAAMYWYHPHPDKKTTEQAIKGAAGLIIVRDSVEGALTLPRRYGVDDFPLVVQSQQYDSLHQAMPLGMQDSTLLVNGTTNPFLNVPAQVVRLRLLNASGERTFNFGFSANKQFYVIASDDGLLNEPFLTTRIRLSPGERAEVLLDLSGMSNQSLHLMCYGSELPMGVQGGPTMPMPPGSPPMNSPLNGVDYNILKLDVVQQTANPVLTIPTSLTTNTPYLESQAAITRTIRFTADSIMVMDGPFYFNDSTFDMMRIDYNIPLNSIEIWKLVNETMVAHPFHIHDEHFYILDRNGNAPGPEESGLKDVVLVPPGDSLRFIVRFTDFTDTVTPYMYHCHILMHEDAGMMGQFIVSPASPAGIPPICTSDPGKFSISPNPVHSVLRLQVNADEKMLSANIFSLHGELQWHSDYISNDTVNVEHLPTGLYILQVKTDKQTYYRKFIKE